MAITMQDLRSLEIFEIEVLDFLNSTRVLEHLYFGGGTMMRLCHNLNRYSTDLDFWIQPDNDAVGLYNKINKSLPTKYDVVDNADKNYTLLFQIRTPNVKRSLKIEIRKEQENFDWERKIAFSKYTIKQVQVKGLTLEQMMKNKIEALLSRKLIRDCFDIDFLLRRGITLPDDREKLKNILSVINLFKDRDYKVTLGSILEAEERKFYCEDKFQFLKQEITALLQ